MTLFKDPNSYNYIFYGAIIVLAIIGSLFFGEPASPEHLTNKSEEFVETQKERLKYHKYLGDELASASKPVVFNHPDTITDLLDVLDLLVLQKINYLLLQELLSHHKKHNCNCWGL